MSDSNNLLGEFLRARRELVSPTTAGIAIQRNRRVAGLRREEVAMLAGISVEYYLRLEQGRDRHPSEQVLTALARVLHLEDEATAYLLELAAAGRTPRKLRRYRAESPPASLIKLIPALPFPAFIEGRYLDVLAANALATALSPRLVAGNNRLRDVFLDPEERSLFPEWEATAAALIAGFRQSVGSDTDDARVVELVGELSVASPTFSRLWSRHDVRERQGGTVTFQHPSLGDLMVHREKLEVTGTEGIVLVVYHGARPEADEKLTLLGAMVADETRAENAANTANAAADSGSPGPQPR